MVLKVKEYFEKTRHVKNNDKSKKCISREHIMNELYLLKGNLVSFHKRTI